MNYRESLRIVDPTLRDGGLVNDFRRIDGSHHDDDVRVVFFIYLRAFGPNSMLDLGRF